MMTMVPSGSSVVVCLKRSGMKMRGEGAGSFMPRRISRRVRCWMTQPLAKSSAVKRRTA